MTTRSALVAALSVGLVLLASGCGDDAAAPTPTAPTHLQLANGDARLLTIRGETAHEKRARVTLPAAPARLLLRADCLGGSTHSMMRIAVSSHGGSDAFYGGGGVGCTRSAGAGGLVVLGNATEQLPGNRVYTVEITAPPGATWSAAVDVDTNGH